MKTIDFTYNTPLYIMTGLLSAGIHHVARFYVCNVARFSGFDGFDWRSKDWVCMYYPLCDRDFMGYTSMPLADDDMRVARTD